jgi:hypothetical protein
MLTGKSVTFVLLQDYFGQFGHGTHSILISEMFFFKNTFNKAKVGICQGCHLSYKPLWVVLIS